MLALQGRNAVLLGLLVLAFGCKEHKKEGDDPGSQIPTASPVLTAPPVTATPVEAFADAGSLEGKSPFEQARAYEANGQHWLARLVLEKEALGEDGTPAERELLLRVCEAQGDENCVYEVSTLLGRKVKKPKADVGAKVELGEHKEPDTTAARARTFFLKRRYKEARALLEPKVLEDSASSDEVRLLLNVCKAQKDRLCMALCESKLR